MRAVLDAPDAVPLLDEQALQLGRWMAGYYACAPDVTVAGGIYEEIAVDAALVDGNLVTGVAWPAHPQWMAAFVKLLGATIQL